MTSFNVKVNIYVFLNPVFLKSVIVFVIVDFHKNVLQSQSATIGSVCLPCKRLSIEINNYNIL
jgi:hypothetical protein